MRQVYRSKNELVYDMLREAILHGEYRPGARLVIDDLAADLGTSHIPIREALRQLEADGFVTIEPYVGATVTDINTDFILEVFALLEALEVISSRAACQRMSDDELTQLARRIDGMESSMDNPDAWSRENKALHQFICDRARLSLIEKMMAKALDHWDRLRLHYVNDVFARRIRLAQQDHRDMLKAFQTRDPDEVERVVRKHNQSALAAYVDHLRSAGQLDGTQEGP